MEFREDQIERYSRQIILKEVGGKGQEKLLSSRILVIGAGGLGSPVLLYLAAAGVGTIGVVDSDRVDLSNLQRQVLHFTKDVGKHKTESAYDKLKSLNPDLNIKIYNLRLNSENIREIIRDYDFIIDGTDNFPAKYLINDACFFERKPYSHAGVLRFDGQTITIIPRESACYRCIFPSPPPLGVVPTCSQAGILGVVPGVIGLIQATEAIKFMLGIGELLTDTLLTYNALSTEIRKISVKKNPNCPLCGHNPEITKLRDEEQPVCDLPKKQ